MDGPYIKFKRVDGEVCYYKEDSDSLIALNNLSVELKAMRDELKDAGPDMINKNFKKSLIKKTERWERLTRGRREK